MKLRTKEEIRRKLDSIAVKTQRNEQLSLNDREWLTRSLMAIYEGQTSQEKLAGVTVEDNGIGFSGVDAEILTSFADQWRSKQWLTYKQFATLAKKMPKYSGQLAKIAAAKSEVPVVTASLSESPRDEDGNIEFPNGSTFKLEMMKPQFFGGETVAWRAVAGGQEYILTND